METTTDSLSGLEGVRAEKAVLAGDNKNTVSSSASANGTEASTKKGSPAQDLAPRDPVEINLRTLLQAGVHFGHQTSRWNPKMAHYIYGARNGIHVIDLPKTLQCWESARRCIVDVVSNGSAVLFVGTKKQAEEAVVEEARRCGAFYVSRRWLGGMITNFQTIRKSIARMNKVEEILAEEEKTMKEGGTTRFTKKERLMMSREREKLDFSLGGIREMYAPPQLLFVIDIKREDIAVKEARRIDIPVVALVDSNCDPSTVSHPIPSNDDGTRAIRLFCAAVADAVSEGKRIYAQRKEREAVSASLSRRRVHSAPVQAAAQPSNSETAVVAQATEGDSQTETSSDAAAVAPEDSPPENN